MSAILIHPSKGSGDGRLNVGRSLFTPVPLDSLVAASLTANERDELQGRHGTEARFWGTYRHNLKKYQRVTEGDPVVFTGDGGIWAVGRIGFQFQNRRFAAALWHSHPEKGVYEYVYSVTGYASVDIPYASINEALGYKPGNHFQGMASYEGRQADAVIAALGL